MTQCIGFAPVSRGDARVLILGTLPSAESLLQQQYYAKKQNSFWRVMGALIGASPDLAYRDRLHCLVENRFALWDVCEKAQRKGSLDAAIHNPTPNDFGTFFKYHKNIKLICFNGHTAEKLFRQYIASKLSEETLSLPRIVLPSTSPAHAGMRIEQKLVRWHAALKEHMAQTVKQRLSEEKTSPQS